MGQGVSGCDRERIQSAGNAQKMSSNASVFRHTRGFDIVKPISVVTLVVIMLPLILLPLVSIFIFGMSNGVDGFWRALTQPEAIFALKLSMVTSFWATVFNVL